MALIGSERCCRGQRIAHRARPRLVSPLHLSPDPPNPETTAASRSMPASKLARWHPSSGSKLRSSVAGPPGPDRAAVRRRLLPRPDRALLETVWLSGVLAARLATLVRYAAGPTRAHHARGVPVMQGGSFGNSNYRRAAPAREETTRRTADESILTEWFPNHSASLQLRHGSAVAERTTRSGSHRTAEVDQRWRSVTVSIIDRQEHF